MTKKRDKNQKFFESIADRLGNTYFQLFERWQDEQNYEDVAEYEAVIQKLLPEYKITMARDPFAFFFFHEGFRFYFFLEETEMTLTLCMDVEKQ